MNAIKVTGLTKKYKDFPAVDDISFEVREGEFFALLGENGAGKSTTINMLCTILEKTSGEVRIAGHELGVEDDEIRKDIGIVFQNSVLDNKLSVRENLYTRGAYYGMSKREITARLEPFMDKFKLEEILDRKYEKLSGGQRRRVDIIRALLHNPTILFMDEPTTGLDPMSRKMVWDYIDYLRKERKMTIFLTTHYMEEVRDADSVVILDKGRIIAQDTPAGLKRSFTNGKLIWYVGESEEAANLLRRSFSEFEYDADHYTIPIKESNFDITGYLFENREKIKDYEVVKGNLDDVFLNLTGRKIAET